MDEQCNNRTRWLHIRLTETEYAKLQKGFSTSVKQTISEYARDLLLDKPVTVYTRDKSLDDAVYMLGAIRKELAAIGNNFNQVVKKLHGAATIHAFKDSLAEAVNYYETFIGKTDALNRQVEKIFRQWLQE